MTKLRVESFTISIDGFGAGRDQSLENPLGVGGTALHGWAFATRTFQAQLFGSKDGETGIDDDFAARGFHNVGAWIMGRNMFGPVRGAWPDESWRGWWGAGRYGFIESADGLHWNEIPFEFDIRVIAAGKGRFVAAGREYTWVSPGDQNHHPLCTNYCDITVQGLVFDGTKFVGVAATHGFVGSSPDGMTWTWQRAPTEEALNDIAYGPAGYIAVGEHGTLLSSPNGSAWSREPAGNGGTFFDAAFGNQTFMLVGAASQDNGGLSYGRRILRSPSGTAWEETLPPANLPAAEEVPVRAVTYGNGKWVALSPPGDSFVQVSTNGADWFAAATIPGGTSVAPDGRGGFVAVGNTFALGDWGVWSSSDGLAWQQTRTPLLPAQLRGVTYGRGSFLAAGESNLWASSADGSSWQVPYAWSAKTAWNRLAYGNGTFVAVGDFGVVGSSPFQRASSKTIQSLYGLAFGDNAFVAVGAVGTIVSSPDGATWTLRNSGTREDLYGVTYGNGRFIVAGANGTILESGARELWFTGISASRNGVQINLNTVGGPSLGFQVSTNLVDWTASPSISSTPNGSVFLDLDPPTLPQRFYRTVLP